MNNLKEFNTYLDGINSEMWNDRNMPGFMTDVTPNVSKHRGNEIDQWLKECKTPCNYVIIDDLDETSFNAHQLELLIKIDPSKGLKEAAAIQAITILKDGAN